MQINNFTLLVILSFVFADVCFAQSGRTAEPVLTPAEAKSEKNVQHPADLQELEPVRLITVAGFGDFLQELNKLGKIGYRLDKSFNYGGMNQIFAAIVRLDKGSAYEYDWLTSPDKNLLETRLNAKASKGFHFAGAFALTSCDEKDSDSGDDGRTDPTDTRAVLDADLFRIKKGDVFLFEQKNGAVTKTKEYKVLIGKIGLGKNPTQVLQTGLDSAPPGFRPAKILFTKTGLIDFSVSILLEKDLLADNPPKIEYRFIKEINGFEKEVNTQAKDGFKIYASRRIGTIKYALMSKTENEQTVYTFVNVEKYEKELPAALAENVIYQTSMQGDTTCDSTETGGGKLIFAKSDQKIDYKILKLIDRKSFVSKVQAISEYVALLKDGYRARNFFYSDGLNLILEK